MSSRTIGFPDRLQERLDAFVADGWAGSGDEIVVEALRRFLDSHEPGVLESQMMNDVQWGLHGDE